MRNHNLVDTTGLGAAKGDEPEPATLERSVHFLLHQDLYQIAIAFRNGL